ncbi:MAG: molybdate ABC transporter substrate-binding protein [Nitrospirales bacterium]|nr:molybdate ABC transporter substrate-binding protein [Nitrospira sp.]MDR4499886.1 molybdate ABC transporter substrate-binding protein [Nitrospirales bacterium]
MTTTSIWKKLGIVIAVGGILSLVATKESVQAEPLTVGAPPSMKAALQEIVPMFEDEYGESVKVVYSASPTLRRQVEKGAPIDVFLGASTEDVNILHDKNMTLYNGPQPYAETSLVLVMSSQSYAMPISFNEAIPNQATIALGHPRTSSLGEVTYQALADLSPVHKKQGKFIHAKHAEDIMNLIHTGKAEMGIVYRSDAISNGKVYIVDEEPTGTHVPVQLGQAIVSTCREASLPVAKKFFDYMLSARIQKLMLKYGFDSVSPNQLS